MRLLERLGTGDGLAVATLVLLRAAPGAAVTALPGRLTDQAFWDLSASRSEPGGPFHSENFVSNEGQFQHVIPDLIARARSGGLYLGVGPEQTFTCVARCRSRTRIWRASPASTARPSSPTVRISTTASPASRAGSAVPACRPTPS